jgi:hypothetical protein
MIARTHHLTFPGALLERGFWLYVWRVKSPEAEYLYVGRTGDSSSPNAVAAYQRMTQHLGRQKQQNALHRHLETNDVRPEQCLFHFIAHGPIYPQARDMEAHRAPRDTVAALEKALADALKAAGYNVLNRVNCRKPLDSVLFTKVRTAFADHFPALHRTATPDTFP